MCQKWRVALSEFVAVVVERMVRPRARYLARSRVGMGSWMIVVVVVVVVVEAVVEAVVVVLLLEKLCPFVVLVLSTDRLIE